ncbi:response regulator transcription factor [Actinomadura sp. 3N407]|uniref:response regulator transcription factor n=1 Tax=Actinomadura sp. 3N407 TaxID=3457423 RepID=UPI003FCDE101
MILDVMMPGLDGFEVLRRLRKTSDVPVILLTARDEELDRIVGFNAGGDDYVTKPFSARELALRVRAILRRSAASGGAAGPDDAILRFDGLLIDPARRTVAVEDGRVIELTALDFDTGVTGLSDVTGLPAAGPRGSWVRGGRHRPGHVPCHRCRFNQARVTRSRSLTGGQCP